MRTTLDIDDDVLLAAKERAKREHKTAGAVISALLRQALTAPVTTGASVVRETPAVFGLRPFPGRGGIVTNDLIDQLRSDDAY
jgi:hypothetical protein